MYFSISKLKADIANVVSTLIGSELSTVGANNTPSVFLARSKVPRPAYPFATVDNLPTSNRGLKQMESFVDENGNNVSRHHKEVEIVIKVYGGINDDTQGIAQYLGDLFLLDRGLYLVSETSGCEVVDVSDIVFASATLNTEYEEVSTIRLTLAVAYEYETISTGVIETIRIGVDGDLEDDGEEIVIEAGQPAN